MATAFTPINIEARKNLQFAAGDTVRVFSKIKDKDKYRLQAFEGMVLARKHGTSPSATFTVRKVSNGVGVERIFPLYSPLVDKIEVVKKTKARRAKLYYVREKAVKEVKRKMKAVTLGKAISTDDTEVEAPIESEVATDSATETNE
jgi:large subunit ribosomal protein L19